MLSPQPFSFTWRIAGILFLTVLILPSLAQMSVTRVKEPSAISGKQGILYVLPRTSFRIDVRVTRKEQIKGPLADYAESFLGITDAIKENKTRFYIDEIEVTPFAEPDPDQYYFLEWGNKVVTPLNVQVSAEGFMMGAAVDKEKTTGIYDTWQSFGTIAGAETFPVYRSGSMKEQVDSVIRRISIDTAYYEEISFYRYLTKQSEEDKAVEAAQIIRAVKSDKYNLLIGYQETAYEKEAIEYMIGELDNIEREYVKLFTGITAQQTLEFSFIYTPQQNMVGLEVPLFGFTESGGFTQSTNDVTDVMINVSPVSSFGAYGGAAPTTAGSGIIYRIPAGFDVVISQGSKDFLKKRLMINQFGTLSTLPSNVTYVEFDPATGVPSKVVVQP